MMRASRRLFTERDVEILLEHAYMEGAAGVDLGKSHYAFRESRFGNGPRGATLLADYDLGEAHLANGELDFPADEPMFVLRASEVGDRHDVARRAVLEWDSMAAWRRQHPGRVSAG